MQRKLGAALLGAALLLSSSACAIFRKDDRARVGDFLAARIYFEDRYERLCATVPRVGPKEGCEKYRVALQEWKRLNDVANQVQIVGTMPDAEVRELRAVMKKCEALP